MVSHSAVLIAALCCIGVTSSQILRTAKPVDNAAAVPGSNRDGRIFGYFKKLIGGGGGGGGSHHGGGYTTNHVHQSSGYPIYPAAPSSGYGSAHAHGPMETTTRKVDVNHGQKYFNPFYSQNFLGNHRYLVDATRDKSYLDEHEKDKSVLSFFFRKNRGNKNNYNNNNNNNH